MSEIDAVGREVSAVLVDKVRSGSLPQSIDTYAALVRDGRVALDEALTEVLETGRLVEAAQLIARVLGLAEGVALNLLYGVYDQGAAVLVKRGGSATRSCCGWSGRVPASPGFARPTRGGRLRRRRRSGPAKPAMSSTSS